MSVWQDWLRRPQNFWVRRALFQIHLWTGIGAGLYILIMSLTGAVLIYRRSLSTLTSSQAKFVQITPHRMTVDELRANAVRLYPGYTVEGIYQSRNLSRPIEIGMTQGAKHIDHIFDPYTGADMGPTMTRGAKVLNWILELHDNLLLPHDAGAEANAIGGILLVLMTLTGFVIWWPGLGRWRSSLGLEIKSGLKKFNWSLHSALGIWCILFVFMFAFTGIYLAMPNPFDNVVEYLDPPPQGSRAPTFGDQFLYWLSAIHFGRIGGLWMEITWTVLGLVPLVLFVTGAFMWWNRVLSPWLKRSRELRAGAHRGQSPQQQTPVGV